MSSAPRVVSPAETMKWSVWTGPRSEQSLLWIRLTNFLPKMQGSSLDNMCYFTINSVNFDQAGDWECTLYSDCEELNDREEEFGPDDTDSEGFFGRRKRQVEDRRCKAAGCRNDGYCNNQATQTVNIGVFSRQDIGALPAQRVYHANAGEEVSQSYQ